VNERSDRHVGARADDCAVQHGRPGGDIREGGDLAPEDRRMRPYEHVIAHDDEVITTTDRARPDHGVLVDDRRGSDLDARALRVDHGPVQQPTLWPDANIADENRGRSHESGRVYGRLTSSVSYEQLTSSWRRKPMLPAHMASGSTSW
jgi:hypothetical protein